MLLKGLKLSAKILMIKKLNYEKYKYNNYFELFYNNYYKNKYF